MARSFNNTTDDINLATRMSSATDNFSAFCWINPVINQQCGCIFYNGSDQNGWGLFAGEEFDSTGNHLIGLCGSVAWVYDGPVLTNAVWQNVGIIRRSGSFRLVLNGSETTPGNGTTSTPNSPGALGSIGMQWTTDSKTAEQRHFDGSICELAVWDIALTAADHAMLAARVSPMMVRPDALVYYAPIIGRYSPEIDYFGANNGTVNGTTTVAHPRIIYPAGSSHVGIPQTAAPATVVQDIIGMGIIPFPR